MGKEFKIQMSESSSISDSPSRDISIGQLTGAQDKVKATPDFKARDNVIPQDSHRNAAMQLANTIEGNQQSILEISDEDAYSNNYSDFK